MKRTKSKPDNRHPDLLTTQEAGERMGAPGGRLDLVDPEFRPKPLPYNERLYHKDAVDDAITRAARQTNPTLKLHRAG